MKIIGFLLALGILLLASCSLDTPTQTPRDNPLDIHTPWVSLTGNSIYCKEDIGSFARLTQVAKTDTTFTDRVITIRQSTSAAEVCAPEIQPEEHIPTKRFA